MRTSYSQVISLIFMARLAFLGMSLRLQVYTELMWDHWGGGGIKQGEETQEVADANVQEQQQIWKFEIN